MGCWSGSFFTVVGASMQPPCPASNPNGAKAPHAAGCVQEWGGDGLVPASCQWHGALQGRAVPAPARSLCLNAPCIARPLPITSSSLRVLFVVLSLLDYICVKGFTRRGKISAMRIRRTGIVLEPDSSRVFFRLFDFTSRERVLEIIARAMSLSES